MDYFDNAWYEGEQINANTGMPNYGGAQTTSVDASGNVQPFGHLQRLADKLVGGVLTAAESAIDEALNPADIAQPVPGQLSFLPQELSTYVNRNMATIAIAGIVFLLVLFLSVRR